MSRIICGMRRYNLACELFADMRRHQEVGGHLAIREGEAYTWDPEVNEWALLRAYTRQEERAESGIYDSDPNRRISMAGLIAQLTAKRLELGLPRTAELSLGVVVATGNPSAGPGYEFANILGFAVREFEDGTRAIVLEL